MLLRKLEVTNSRGSLLDIPLEVEVSNGFYIRKIDGLGPVKATLVSSSFANMDGAQYHSSRREPRNIVIELGLDPEYSYQSVQDLRDQLYEFFMPENEALLKFNVFDKNAESVLDQILDLQIYGRIESADPDIFTSDPSMTISLMCFEPDFIDPVQVEVESTTVTDNTKTLVVYPGNIETGLLFEIRPDRNLNDFSIYNRLPDNTLLSVDVSYPLIAGDVLQISSIFGQKHATLIRGGVESPVLYAISPQSAWLKLDKGTNKVHVQAAGAAVPYSLFYYHKYGGL